MLLLAILAFVLVDVKFGHEEKALSTRGPCSLTFPPNLNLGIPHETRFVGIVQGQGSMQRPVKCFGIAYETKILGGNLFWNLL